MADVPMKHLLLADSLAFVLLRAVNVILMHHGAAVLTQLRSGYLRELQITAQVFHAAPGLAGLFGGVDLP